MGLEAWRESLKRRGPGVGVWWKQRRKQPPKTPFSAAFLTGIETDMVKPVIPHVHPTKLGRVAYGAPEDQQNDVVGYCYIASFSPVWLCLVILLFIQILLEIRGRR
jgi:hypothetical protein